MAPGTDAMVQTRWAEIEAAFAALVDAEDDERARRLEAIGRRDPELRATLAALLNADATVDAHLAGVEAKLANVTGFLSGTPGSSAMGDPFGMSGRMIAHFRVGAPLGVGGIGVVYRAEDTRLGRTVALKFLRPDRVADKTTRQRFLREARSIAALEHPNLCAIHEVGEDVDGTPFLAMALYEGETLEQRLARERRLAIGDALAIAKQVAAALACVHAAGVVHRDVKPGNIMLLPDGTLRLVDFGLAKAPENTLTHAGELLGTVAYMAPEQVAGDPAEARADLWALGVVLYEMLTGRRPFTGEHEVAIAYAIRNQSPARPSKLRRDVPAAVDRFLLGLLEKDPSRRRLTAAQVTNAIAALPAHGPPRTARGRRIAMVALPLTVLSAIYAVRLRTVAEVASAAKQARSLISPAPAPLALDERLVMVTPFRVAASDSSVRFLGEGMMDLVSAKLTGSVRAVDARGVLREWRRAGGGDRSEVDRPALVGIARQFGAGRVLDGSIVETAPGEIEVTGSFIDVSRPDSVLAARAHGRAANVAALLDTVVATLLVTNYEGRAETGARLADVPLDALEAYLAGQFAFRGGHYLEAARDFRHAVQIDSTFALAAVRLDLAAVYSDVRYGIGAMAIARAHRDELGTVDRLLLETQENEFGLEHLAVQERAVQTAPEVPEFWFDLGGNLTHAGAVMGIEDAQQRAIAAFGRALALDSAFTPARLHLLLPYILLGDTAHVRSLLAQLHPDGELVAGARWLGFGNRADLAAELRAIPNHRLPPYRATPAIILGRVEDLEWAAHYMDSTATTRSDRAYVAAFTRWLALNRGQPARARRSSSEPIEPDEPPLPLGFGLETGAFTAGAGILEVLLWGADPRDAGPGLAALDSALHAPAPNERSAHAAWQIELFAAGEFELSIGRMDLARAAAMRLRGDARAVGDTALARCARHAALLLETQVAATTLRPDAARLARVADSVLRRFDPGSEYLDAAGSLIMARVWERLGDLPRALAATRRVAPTLILWPFYSSYLRERGRLSARAGDREDAIEAYDAYVKLRARAEPSQIPDLDAAKRELDGLRSINPRPRH